MRSTNQLLVIDFIKSITNDYIINKNQIELLIQDVLGCEKIDLYTNKDLAINNKQFHIISEFIERIKEGEPIQYILGKAPFYGRQFFITKDVLIPRFDTELIIDILNEHGPCNKLLEIGVGSGNISLTIAKENLANEIMATDISEKQLSIAEFNKKIICPNAKVEFIIDDFLKSNLCPNEKFDVIVSNPPYIPLSQIEYLDDLVKNHEPINALTDGSGGYRFYKKFALIGNVLVKENGFMLLEIGVDNKLECLYDIFNNYKIQVYKDLNQKPRVIKVF